ncbi:arylamine N-acetyltransferase [Streptomyces sp. A7024]|uniref:Arylamine N-acetyltransferase n=2 Tax=Streptomyces coryli TaxID=1128680 RepID=A0A6G4UCS1_9ACTN|nr:arylamine N-acetyltransferase [Streptomyces coryli]NGN69001.1 arylamine N-acetyltransferase [Streptomyces coryli]
MQANNSAGHWSGDELDLDGYLNRIGFTGERAPTLATLGRLQRAHTTSIPFENVHAVLGKPLPIDLASVQERLVGRRRGGYCYEHVALFAAALERLGFGVTVVTGRVTLGFDRITPATHALVVVRCADDDRDWLCDVGFGSGPTAPIELADGAEVEGEGWRHRLERRPDEWGDTWWLLQYGPEGWTDRHTFRLVPQYPIDFAVGSHFVDTHPRSPFVKRLFAQRFTGREHHVLDATVWTTSFPDGTSTRQEIEPEQVGKLLAEVFDIAPAPEELDRILG